MLEASLLAEFLPRARVAILDRGRQMGYDRALGGVHYPSDVEGGQRVGAAFARDWLADPEHRRRLEQVRAAEW
jgi:acid phosphatase (class A)